MRLIRRAALAALLALTGSCSAAPSATEAIERLAHDTYVAAINSNDADTLLADLTDDVVYQAPGAPEVVGKAAVGEWVRSYLATYRTKWEKTSLGFTVAGDWAFERYTYKVADTDKVTGTVITDVGKGINVFRKGKDGKWRVALDGWSSDRPVS
ncbi:nuclear transport factor 2 family protein [Novosphingobium sp. AP12]|uniref:YybH family protein n=1 Tax=Novosphingobium sp. AP12 TaxID=1144305 RepID=UPI000271F149|nr:nuclear transport factor 2 family protein [Novosphingobium sp. AP12]EJL31145.1 ketosteroid isomerase-like enzyme [Novosphingobium sp. AP12]